MSAVAFVTAGSTAPALAEVRVQDVAILQGQRTNKLQGIGLVVGLNGTGDGGKYANAMRALMSLHRKYEQPVLDVNELRTNANVALVMVEATIPQFGAREGQTLDVIVSCIGPARSLQNGQLLTTPLQDATLAITDILALAGGRIEVNDPKLATRGVIRAGATLEQDFFYSFVQDGYITLVLNDSQAGYPMSRMIARAVNRELATPVSEAASPEGAAEANPSPDADFASAIGPKNVTVRIPEYELAQPAGFISRVLQTPLFVMPQQPARVVINRTTKSVSFTGVVTIAPTVLQIPGLGSVTVGNGQQNAGNSGLVGLDTENAGGVKFQDLMTTLDKMKVTGKQLVEAVEQLERTGTLHAQVVYTE